MNNSKNKRCKSTPLDYCNIFDNLIKTDANLFDLPLWSIFPLAMPSGLLTGHKAKLLRAKRSRLIGSSRSLRSLALETFRVSVLIFSVETRLGGDRGRVNKFVGMTFVGQINKTVMNDGRSALLPKLIKSFSLTNINYYIYSAQF